MLTEQLTADAAALHQAILDHGGEVSPFFCGKELAGSTAASPGPWRSWWPLIIDPAAAILPKP